MRKKIVLVCTVAATAFAVSACGSGSVTNEFMDKLEQHAEHNTSYIKEEQASSQVSMESLIDGTEKEKIVKVISNTNIMNKPSSDGTIVGEVKRNESVLLIGENNVGGWYKVAYNGRVCYVKGTSLDIQNFVVDNGEVNNGDNDKPTTSTTSSQTTSVNAGETISSGGAEISDSDVSTSSGNLSGGESSSQDVTTSGNESSSSFNDNDQSSSSDGDSQESSESGSSLETTPPTESDSSSETAPPTELDSSSETAPPTESDGSSETTLPTESDSSSETVPPTESDSSSETAPPAETTYGEEQWQSETETTTSPSEDNWWSWTNQ